MRIRETRRLRGTAGVWEAGRFRGAGVRLARRIHAVPKMAAVTYLVRGSAVGLGFVSGMLIVLTPSAVRGAPLWPVWASLAVALTSVAGAVFGYGLARWADLTAVRPVRVRDVGVPAAGLLAVAVLAGLAGLALTVTAHRAGTGWSAFRGWALMSVALLGAVPAVAVMYGIRHVAGRGESGLTSCVDVLRQTGAMRKQYHFWPGEGGIDAWDVDLLIGRVARLPVEEVVLDDLPEIDSEYWFDERERPTVRKVIEHFRLVGAVDPSYPIILGPGNRVMDGMHRVARALLDGRRTIKARRLRELPEPDYRGCHPDELPY